MWRIECQPREEIQVFLAESADFHARAGRRGRKMRGKPTQHLGWFSLKQQPRFRDFFKGLERTLHFGQMLAADMQTTRRRAIALSFRFTSAKWNRFDPVPEHGDFEQLGARCTSVALATPEN